MALEAETAWDARQASTGKPGRAAPHPSSPRSHSEPEPGLGQLGTGDCSQRQHRDGCAIAQNPAAALREGRDEGIRTRLWPHSRWETLTDAFHRCSRASLFLHCYHRSTTCPLPDRTPHADKTPLVLTPSCLQPALLHWKLTTSPVSPGAAPQKVTSLEAPHCCPQILELCC